VLLGKIRSGPVPPVGRELLDFHLRVCGKLFPGLPAGGWFTGSSVWGVGYLPIRSRPFSIRRFQMWRSGEIGSQDSKI
jgi:hypothetical protein